MINSRFVLAIVCGLSVLTVDFVSAQSKSKKDPIFKKPLLFRRAKEYQREQLKQELKGELYSELSDKLDEDVAVATETLRKATEAKVASESKKLQNQAKTHQQRLTANAKALAAQLSADANSRASELSKQHAAAVKVVTEQGKAIAEANANFKKELNLAHQDAMTKLAQENTRARKRLVAAFKKLNDEFELASKEQARANEKMIADLTKTSATGLAEKVDELVKALAKQNDEFAANLAKKLATDNQSVIATTKADLEQAFADLTTEVKSQVDEAVAQLTAQQAEPEPAPEPAPIPEEQDAVPTTPVTPQDEGNEDEQSFKS